MAAYATAAKGCFITIDCNMVKGKRFCLDLDSSTIAGGIIEDSSSIDG